MDISPHWGEMAPIIRPLIGLTWAAPMYSLIFLAQDRFIALDPVAIAMGSPNHLLIFLIRGNPPMAGTWRPPSAHGQGQGTAPIESNTPHYRFYSSYALK